MWRTRRNPAGWLVACRDIAGRRHHLVITPTEDGRIALVGPAGETVLDLLAAGRLRGALRDAAYALDHPETAHLHRHEIALTGTAP